MVPTSPVNYSTLQGLSQDFISTEVKGKLEVWGGALSRLRGRAPGQGSGAKPPEAESFSVVGCPKEMENVPQFYHFTTYLLFSKMSSAACVQQCCGEVSLGDRL